MHFFKKFFDAANQSAEAVNRQIIRITQRNLEAGLDLAKSLASARDPFEIAKLQASFWWKQLNECTAQAEEVRRRLFGFSAIEPELAPEPERTPEPGIKEFTSNSLTPQQQERNPAAQDPSKARPKPEVADADFLGPNPSYCESDVGRPKSGPREALQKRNLRNLHPHNPAQETGGAKASRNEYTYTPGRSRRCCSAT